MNRRDAMKILFAGLAGATGVGVTLALWRDGVKEKVKSTITHLKPSFRLPMEGEKVSVEKALNSRCTSDNDGDTTKFHWGKFDRWRELTDAQADKVVSIARIPRFTEAAPIIKRNANILTFTSAKTKPGVPQSWAMVENGMLQQAVCLVCSSLGVGMVFSNLGKDGMWVSDSEYAAIDIRIGAMEPSYEGAYWTPLPPAGKNPWQKGNLPDPVRDGQKPLLSILGDVKTENRDGALATEQSISQLLWAGRGRTPHLYNSKPWGMTIPTWAGEQNISGLHLVSEEKLFRYANWSDKQPTHSLLQLKTIKPGEVKEILARFSASLALIVINKNEQFARALWEAGYQLMNMLLQASSLNISYGAFLLREKDKEKLERIGVADPVAVMAL
jgi:hypothetical protein